MDPEISSWVIEWLLRNRALDTFVKDSLRNLPLSDCGSRVRKLILLRIIQAEVSEGLIAETVLDNLEMIEELNRIEGASVTEVMKEAYCAVAVECTLKFLAASPDNNPDYNPDYIKAVDKIWRGRIRLMGASNNSMLFSSELNEWKNDIELSLGDPQTCQRLFNVPSRRNALKKVKVYLEEAFGEMGPSFLETVKAHQAACGFECEAKPMNNDEGRSDGQELGRLVSPTQEERGFVSEAELVNKDELRSDGQELGRDGSPTREEIGFVSEAEPVNKDEGRSEGQELGRGGSPTREETATTGFVSVAKPTNKDEGRLDSQELGSGSPTPEETGSLPETTCRLHLPSPKRSKISPLKEYEDKKFTKRRIVKKWSVLEEDTLRASVHKFGEGHWKTILSCHPDVFEHRTAVDLKDKWRNMKRHG